jgi:hypothetical protein
MAYCDVNFRTKRDLQAAVSSGRQLTVYTPGGFHPCPRDGQVTVEGPHYPEPHRWYCRVTLANGVIVKAERASLGDGKVTKAAPRAPRKAGTTLCKDRQRADRMFADLRVQRWLRAHGL